MLSSRSYRRYTDLGPSAPIFSQVVATFPLRYRLRVARIPCSVDRDSFSGPCVPHYLCLSGEVPRVIQSRYGVICRVGIHAHPLGFTHTLLDIRTPIIS